MLDLITQEIQTAHGWLPFDRYMSLVLYAPNMGYYSRNEGGGRPSIVPAKVSSRQNVPNVPYKPQRPCESVHYENAPLQNRDGSYLAGSALRAGLLGVGGDFITAPELTPLFAQSLASQVAQALQETQSQEIWEFGPGTGALARDLLLQLSIMGLTPKVYHLVDLPASLMQCQRHTLKDFGTVVQWAQTLPQAISGVVIGNEVLDAMPVKVLARHEGAEQGQWFEKGVALGGIQVGHDGSSGLVWAERPTDLSPPVPIEGHHAYVTEIHPQAQAFMRTIAQRLLAGRGGAGFFIDYGFGAEQYWHPQRSMGTLCCHSAHRMDDDPLDRPGQKDITAHVDFTGIALACQQEGLRVLGYTSQARFLLNLGIAQLMAQSAVMERTRAMGLLAESEMGELFKVIGFATPGCVFDAKGFAQGDRTHTL